MRVVAFANQKGGTGKTTLLMNVAAGLERAGRQVVIADADPQGTALRWAHAADTAGMSLAVEVYPLSKAGADLRRELKAIAGKDEIVLVDCPPSVENETTHAALALARLVVVPIALSPPDLWATRGIVHLIARLGGGVRRHRGILVANRVPPRSALGRDVLELLAEFELPLARTVIGSRAAYAQAAALGRSVFDLRRAGAAATEIEALTLELLPLIEGDAP